MNLRMTYLPRLNQNLKNVSRLKLLKQDVFKFGHACSIRYLAYVHCKFGYACSISYFTHVHCKFYHYPSKATEQN